jgi:hypothetical protein
MNILSFPIQQALSYLAPHSSHLTPTERSYAASIIAMFDGLGQLTNNPPFGVIVDIDGGLAKNPLSFIPPIEENGGRAFLRIYPRGLVETVHNFRKSWFTIVRDTSGVTYSSHNPHPTATDALFHYAAHELRHTLQVGRKIFTPDTVEEQRAFLGVALDVHTMHLRERPEHYSQSGPAAIEREFDAEVVAMYASNLWRQKEPHEIRAILLAEPA